MDERSSENWEDALSTFPLYLSKLSSVDCLSLSPSLISATQTTVVCPLLVRLVKAVEGWKHNAHRTHSHAIPRHTTPRSHTLT